MKAHFFDNGNVMVTDDNGNQVTEYQFSWLETWLNRLSEKVAGEFIADIKNIDASDLKELANLRIGKTKIVLPSGKTANIFPTKSGWNWKID